MIINVIARLCHKMVAQVLLYFRLVSFSSVFEGLHECRNEFGGEKNV
jgi:hypothetical protein